MATLPPSEEVALFRRMHFQSAHVKVFLGRDGQDKRGVPGDQGSEGSEDVGGGRGGKGSTVEARTAPAEAPTRNPCRHLP